MPERKLTPASGWVSRMRYGGPLGSKQFGNLDEVIAAAVLEARRYEIERAARECDAISLNLKSFRDVMGRCLSHAADHCARRMRALAAELED